MRIKKIKFHNINFHNIINFESISKNFKKGVFICFPSGPGLSTLDTDTLYKKALMKSDFNLFDSGLFVLLLKISNIKVAKYSGFKFIRDILSFFKFNNINNFLFVDPSFQISKQNRNYLKKNFIESKFHHYVAPKYDYANPFDLKLLRIIETLKPSFLIINIGGNIQEKLGLWIKNNSSYNINIVCTGAAISFLTKSQAPINTFIDRFYLGWFVRCFYNPKIFFPRYIRALTLISIYCKNFKNIMKFYEN